MNKRTQAVLVIFLVAAFIAGGYWLGRRLMPRSVGTATASEQAILNIPLSGPVGGRDAEVSGLGWYGEYLVLLPQYPNRFADGNDGFLYAIPGAQIESFLAGQTQGPLEPLPITLNAPGLAEQIPQYQGFEAIAFDGERVFLTIEAGEGTAMRGYLISGVIASDLSGITLDTSRLVSIPLQDEQDNKSDEAMFLAGGQIVTVYEVNSAALNPSPVAEVFDYGLNQVGSIPFPNLNYRVTDVTTPDASGRFWAINYLFPGDADLVVQTDPLTAAHGEGPTHLQSAAVERLVELQYSTTGITLTETAPIQLELLPPDDARNWEGMVTLGEQGFLIVTDKFPETILAFVKRP